MARLPGTLLRTHQEYPAGRLPPVQEILEGRFLPTDTRSARLRGSMLRCQLLARKLLRGRQSVRRRYGDIWFHPRPFPIRLCDRIDRLRKRYANDKAIIDTYPAYRMSAAAGDLADDGGALQTLEVIAEFLCARESPRRGQHINRNVGEPPSRNIR